VVAAAPPPLLRYLIGLEGLALLSGWLGDGAGAARRIEEIRVLLDERAAPSLVLERPGRTIQPG